MSTNNRIRKNRYKPTPVLKRVTSPARKQVARLKKAKPKKNGLNTIGLKSRWIKNLLIVCLGLSALAFSSIALIFCHDMVTQLDFFAAQKIDVTGCRRTTADRILKTAGFSKNMNILGINLKIARQKILANPWIARAEVRRKLPSELIITVEEHRPMAVLAMGRHFLIDTEGIIFKEWQAGDPDDLPVITGLEYSDLNARGTPRSTSYAAVLDLLHLSGEFVENGLALKIKSISVDREIGLTMHIVNHTQPVQMGYNNYMQKYATLRNVMAYLEREKTLSRVHSIDLKSLERIVIKLSDLNEAAGKEKEV